MRKATASQPDSALGRDHSDLIRRFRHHEVCRSLQPAEFAIVWTHPDSRYTDDRAQMAAKKILMRVGDFVENYEALVDGRLGSSPAWPDHPEWIPKLARGLGTRIEP